MSLTWVIFSSSKHLTTWAIAWVSLIWPRNLFPNPSPFEAPETKPAISTNSTVAGIIFSGFTIFANSSRRESGTVTIPTLGSMVQKGKFSALIPAYVRALNKVDFPTLGKPTIPHFTDIILNEVY